MTRRITLAAACAAVLAITGAHAQPAPGYGPNVGLEMARRAVDAGLADARQRNLQMAVAVVDTAGNLVAFARSDGTQTASITIALEKARSAATFRRPTKAFEDALVGGRMAILALTGAMPVEGGVPLLAENRIIGAIGVSGGTAQEDGMVAAAAAAAGR